MRERG
ncbi:hypothetical protein E2C01_076603 [Portunus trituberculatus]